MAEVVGSAQTGSIAGASGVDEAAEELYGLPPAEFVAARGRLVAAAPGPDVAAAIKALRRPTVAAWAVNRLVRRGAPELEEALELGSRLRDAQRQLRGGELRRLDLRRRELVNELTSLVAEGVGGLAGEALSQVRNTVVAAMADASSAAEVRGGRLVKALEYSGFGPVGGGDVVPDDLSVRREARRSRRLAEALEAVEEAEERVDSCSAAVKVAGREHASLVRELDEVRGALRAAEKAVQQAGRGVEKARQKLVAAEDARKAAVEAVDLLR
jgi:chromosome segregation ATPase